MKLPIHALSLLTLFCPLEAISVPQPPRIDPEVLLWLGSDQGVGVAKCYFKAGVDGVYVVRGFTTATRINDSRRTVSGLLTIGMDAPPGTTFKEAQCDYAGTDFSSDTTATVNVMCTVALKKDTVYRISLVQTNTNADPVRTDLSNPRHLALTDGVLACETKENERVDCFLRPSGSRVHAFTSQVMVSKSTNGSPWAKLAIDFGGVSFDQPITPMTSCSGDKFGDWGNNTTITIVAKCDRTIGPPQIYKLQGRTENRNADGARPTLFCTQSGGSGCGPL